jgi:hypothetical protein
MSAGAPPSSPGSAAPPSTKLFSDVVYFTVRASGEEPVSAVVARGE